VGNNGNLDRLATLLGAGVVALVTIFAVGIEGRAEAGTGVSCPPGTHPVTTGSTSTTVSVTVCVPGSASTQNPEADGGGPLGDYSYTQVTWLPDCPQVNPDASSEGAVNCLAAQSCSDPQQERWIEFGRTVTVTNNVATEFSAWSVITTQCMTNPPAQTGPVLVVTPGMILSATKRLGLPALEVRIQPAGKTLVNFPTIFYTRPRPFDHTITLLGQSIEVQAQPAEYEWLFGDGQTLSGNHPGHPYPAKDITHTYADAHLTVHPRVDVTYSIRYRIGGSGWQQLADTVTVPGPAANLRIAEATPMLSGNGH
jgi:hypothetical protein